MRGIKAMLWDASVLDPNEVDASYPDGVCKQF